MTDLLVLRVMFVALLGGAGYVFRPFELSGPLAAGLGMLAGLGVVLFELRLREISLKRLMGAAVGSILGIFGAFLISLVISRAAPASTNTVPFLQIALLGLMTYCGLVVGGSKGDLLNLSAFGGLFGGEKT